MAGCGTSAPGPGQENVARASYRHPQDNPRNGARRPEGDGSEQRWQRAAQRIGAFSAAGVGAGRFMGPVMVLRRSARA